MSDLVTISGLWFNEEKGFHSGSQGSATFFVFKNKDATGNQPTHSLCVGKRKKKEEAPAEDYSRVGPPPADDDGDPFRMPQFLE